MADVEQEEIQKYIDEQSAKIAGQVLQAAITKYGVGGPTIGAAADILAQATARVASILAKLTGQGDLIVEGITTSMKAYIDNFERFVIEKNDVAVGKEEG